MTGQSRFIRFFGGLLLASLPFSLLGASVVSSSGRFWVSGDVADLNYEYARWAELTAARLEASLGTPIPLTRNEPIEIILDASPANTPDITARLLRPNETLRRLLIVRTVQPVDPVMLQERLVQLLLAGMIEQRRRERGLPPVLPAIPAWYTAGLAGGLDRWQLARSRAVVMAPDSDLATTPLREVFSWSTLPEGWYSRQALCTLVTDWLMSSPAGQSNMIHHLIMQREVTPEVMPGITGASSQEAMELRWRDWLHQQTRLVQEFGVITLEMIEQLRTELWLQVPTVIQGEMALQALSPAEVISERNRHPDIAKLAAVKMASIQRLTLAAAPEFVEVGRNYVAFYEGVARGTWEMVLRRRLKLAEESLRKLAEQTKARREYLDEFESNRGAEWQTREGMAAESTIPGLEKSRMESYLDEAEKRFDKPR